MTARQIRPLMEFVPALSPRFAAPKHLAPYVEVFESIAKGVETRVVCSVPPRHAKTETTKHALVWLLRQNPALRIGYVSYAASLAEKKSREVRELYTRAGGKLAGDASSRKDWRTGTDTGGLWATSVNGQITGEGFDVLVVDDSVKDRATAESGVERAKLYDWFNDTAFTRLEPGGSVIVLGTRWHPDDLIGRLLGEGWASVVLPALSDEGVALWPQRFDAASLVRIKAQLGAYGWASLYQCNPMPRGGAVFTDVYTYDELPTGDVRISIGVDFAYSTKSRADYSVAVVIAVIGDRYFILDVLRMQVAAPDFLSRLQALQARHGGARATAYIGGQEQGVVDTMKKIGTGLNIQTRPATVDKFQRAQPVAAAWCDGRVLVPRKALWLDAFVSEIVSFTGAGDVHDDQVDALAGAFDGLSRSTPKLDSADLAAFTKAMVTANNRWSTTRAEEDDAEWAAAGDSKQINFDLPFVQSGRGRW